MAQQARAVRTRRTILEAAAAVFDEFGYEGASTTEILARSGLTRGALYFHFPSKEAIADAVVDAQNEALVPPPNKVKLQATIDLTMAFAQRLRTDAVLRAAVRLSVEQASYKTPTAAAYRGPADVIFGLLTQAQSRGELLPTVDPGDHPAHRRRVHRDTDPVPGPRGTAGPAAQGRGVVEVHTSLAGHPGGCCRI